jgi:hypothetical protein
MRKEHESAHDVRVQSLSGGEVEQVGGGASIYVDGVYWGEGSIDYHPWPTGIPMSFYPAYRDVR